MANHYVIKVAGAAGQGIKTSGLVLAKALKRAGYCSFGYTEYPSLIRGGHNVYQIEISDTEFCSVTSKLDVLLALNENSVKVHKNELAEGSILIYDDGSFQISDEDKKLFETRKVGVYAIPLLNLAKDNGGSSLMKNAVSIGALWKILGLDLTILNEILSIVFNKGEEIIKTNLKCAEAGYKFVPISQDYVTKNFKTNPDFADNLIISGNEAVGLGAIAAGVRLYSSYPMTPASPILSYLGEVGPKYGMIVKQAEDEITAANMVIGANLAGTRAMCGTSGGGFDLMTETLSLAGIIESPFVVVLGQRPGPGTGVPTWTAQGDLNLAVYSGHGEFPRIVLAPSDPQSAFNLTVAAHNLAEIYQIPVILMTDKLMGESYFCTSPFDVKAVQVDRGKLLEGDNLVKAQGKLRYELSDDGVSHRWLPGDKATVYLANSDEHTERGYSTEGSQEIADMYKKRMLKVETIKKQLPDPEIIGDEYNADICILSWGSNKSEIKEAITELKAAGIKCSYIHYSYIWPLKTERALEVIGKAKSIVSIEANYQGQFNKLFKSETGKEISMQLLKYNGRPFYLEEIINYLKTIK